MLHHSIPSTKVKFSPELFLVKNDNIDLINMYA